MSLLTSGKLLATILLHMVNVFLSWIVLFSLVQNQANADVRSICSALAKVAVSAVKKPLAAIGNKLAPPLDSRLVNASEYEVLRNKKIGEFFPEGKVTDEGISAFLKDFTKVVVNFPRMHLNKKSNLKKIDAVEAQLKNNIDYLFRHGFLDANKEQTLENLLLSENFQNGKPADLVQPTALGQLGRYGLGVAMLPVRFLKGVKNIIIDYGKWGIKNSVTAGTIGVVTTLALGPITDTLSRYTNEYGGPWNMKLSLLISQMENGGGDRAAKLESLNDQLAEVNTKFQIKDMTREQAAKMWDDLEKAFLEHRREMYRVMKDNVASGRGYFHNANVVYPLMFVSSAMTANSELMNHETLVLLYENKKQTGKISPEEEKRLEYHRNEIPKSKQRLAATLVAMKVHEYIYPEYNRAEFMKKNPTSIPLMQSYETFNENYKLEDYAVEFEHEMRRQLAQMGIHYRDGQK